MPMRCYATLPPLTALPLIVFLYPVIGFGCTRLYILAHLLGISLASPDPAASFYSSRDVGGPRVAIRSGDPPTTRSTRIKFAANADGFTA